MRKYIFILIAIILPEGMMAQAEDETLTLSLEEAIEYAYTHNKNLENARQELIKMDKSVWESISQGLPQVDAMVDYMTYFNYELAFQFGVDEDFMFTDEQINQATAQTLAEFTGIPAAGINPVTPQDLYNYNAGSAYERTLQSMMPASTILMSDQLTAKFQVAQLLFSGQYFVGIQTARLAKLISKQALENSEVDTKEAVINSYYLVLISEASLDMVIQNLENLSIMLDQTEKMYKAGMAEAIDVDQFQVTVNQLKNSKRAMERNLEMNYNMLRLTLGLQAGTPLSLTDDLGSLFQELEASELLLSEFNKEKNISYQILNSQAEINKKLWGMEKWNYGPTITGFYNYNAKILTTGFDMTPNHLAGFSLNVPIFSSGMRSAKTTQARIEYEISARNSEILADQLELQESQLKYDLQNSLENYYTQKENVEVAQRVLDNYNRKYKQGMASSLDVTQANSNYLDAQSTYLTSVFEVMNARIQLEKLTNNLSLL